MAVNGESPLMHSFFLKKNIEAKIFESLEQALPNSFSGSFFNISYISFVLQSIANFTTHFSDPFRPIQPPYHCCLLVASEDFEPYNIARVWGGVRGFCLMKREVVGIRKKTCAF